MRGRGRFRFFLLAIGLPMSVVVACIGVQAAVFRTPSHDFLVAADVVQRLLHYRSMQTTEHIGGRTLAATCVQGDVRGSSRSNFRKGAIALLSNGERLYHIGAAAIQRVGHRGTASPLDRGRFLLSGCGDYIANQVAGELLGSKWVEADPTHSPGAKLLIEFGERAKPIQLYVDSRTFQPLELWLTGSPVSGWSTLRPVASRAEVARVRRAFRGVLTWRPERG